MRAVFQYEVLSVFIMMCSGGLVTVLYRLTGLKEVLTKIKVYTCLFGLSFTVQKDIIFKKR